MPIPKKNSKKPSARPARRSTKVVQTRTRPIQDKTAQPVSSLGIPNLSKGRAIFLVALLVVAVAGAVMLVPRQSATSATESALKHTIIYYGEDGKTALDLLKAHHQVAAQQFSIGAFVTAVDGISAPPNYFWSFTVNGKPSDVGADTYVTKNSDTLKWQLELIQ